MTAAPTLDDAVVSELIGEAVTAPSMHNAQPWRFTYARGNGTLRLYADPERGMPHSDPDGRALHIGCGAALFNLRVALAAAGFHADVTLLPDPEDPALLALVRTTPSADGSADGSAAGEDAALRPLGPAIRRRHTSRYPFAEKPVPETVRTTLADAAREEGATLSFPESWQARWVAELADEAEARNLTDQGSEQDLTRWTRIGADEADTATDGVPEYAFGPRKHGGRAPVRDFSGGQPVADRGTTPFEKDPHLAVLGTDGDQPVHWLIAGQAMQRVLLVATLKELATSFSTQALEWPDLRWPLRDPVTGSGHIQMILRIGYGPQGPATPRRPVRDVLVIDD